MQKSRKGKKKTISKISKIINNQVSRVGYKGDSCILNINFMHFINIVKNKKTE